MPKKKKSNKTNPKKPFQTAKVRAGEGSDASFNITRHNKDQKHAPEGSCKERGRNFGNLEISKSQKLAKNTKSKTYQEVLENNKESTTITDNDNIVDNISNPDCYDIRRQGTISSAIVNVNQNGHLLKKQDNQQNQIVSGNQETQETGKANDIHKKHEFSSDAASSIDSEDIKYDRNITVNDDSNLTENMKRHCGGVSGNPNLGYKEIAENKKNTTKIELESCDTKRVGNIMALRKNY